MDGKCRSTLAVPLVRYSRSCSPPTPPDTLLTALESALPPPIDTSGDAQDGPCNGNFDFRDLLK